MVVLCQSCRCTPQSQSKYLSSSNSNRNVDTKSAQLLTVNDLKHINFVHYFFFPIEYNSSIFQFASSFTHINCIDFVLHACKNEYDEFM